MIKFLLPLIFFVFSIVPAFNQDMKEMWGKKNVVKSENKSETKAWFKESKYAMFIHWGLFSQFAGKWQGEPSME